MLFQKKCPPFIIIVLLYVFTVIPGCKNSGQLSPEGYELDKPQRTELSKALNEISGICFSGDDSSLLAISDSKPRVFQINLKTRKLKDYTEKVVDPDSDLEDMVKVDTTLFLLMSKGVLLELSKKVKDTAEIKTYSLNLNGSNDFETVYYDPSVESLILLCKTCAREQGMKLRTAYRFDLRTRSFDSSVFFTIGRSEVKRLLKNDDADFKPSAAAINPVNKRLYILSSAGHLLVITDTRGQVMEAYNLNPDIFPQAEGIAFAPRGDMYITNEGKSGKPTLLYFPYLPNAKKK